MDWLIVFFTSITIFFAAIVHGIAGFGMAQIGMGIMPLFRSTQSAVIIFSILAAISNFRVWLSVRKHFKLMEWIKPVIGLIFGMPMGLYLFNQMNENQAKIAIGIVLLVAVIIIILGKQTNKISKWFENTKYRPKWMLPILVGLTSGILGGAVAISGPPMILYGAFMTSTNIWTNKEMKAIFTAFFGILMLYRTVTVALVGNISLILGFEALITIPAMLLGSWIGIIIFNKISNKVFNWIVVVLLTINAFILLFQ